MSNVAVELSEAIAHVVEKHAPSIVRIEGRHRSPSSGLVWSADGVVITANHTLERDEQIEVGLGSGQAATAIVLGRDPSTDLALLKVDATALTPATFDELAGLRVGHVAVALARPGRSVRATMGIVSALGDNDGFRTHGGGRIDRYVETDIGLRPGFEGGPLVDLSGRLLGFNTTGLLRGATITVPASTIRRVVEKLLAHGKLRRAYLGVGTYPVQLPGKTAKAAGQETALLVVSVQSDGPSDKAGLVIGDVLLSLDGRRLSDMGDLLETLSDDRVGQELKAHILRGGQPTDLTITATARGE